MGLSYVFYCDDFIVYGLRGYNLRDDDELRI